MEKTLPFYDFSIPYNENRKLMRALMTELIDLGYKTIAIDQIYDNTKKNAGKRGADIFPEPVNIKYLQEEFHNQLKILQRITIIYADASITHPMTHSLNLKKFNIIAGLPTTDVALAHCCTTFAGDILCFDEDDAKLLINRKNHSVAVKRGLFFEIKYAPAIRNVNNRKDMIKIAHSYCARGKSKNIIFSSGALNEFELRGPYDVANLAFIFGLAEDQGKNAIDRTCRQLFLKAESRRIGKTIMFVKATGPVCFSDTSSDSENDDLDQTECKDEDKESAEQQESEATSGNENDENEKTTDSESDEELTSPPKKKGKIS